ncbi:ABC transporter ATP-binding protein, partial [Corynebacterium stationis]
MAIKQLVGPSGSGLTKYLTDLYENTPGAVMLTSNPRAHITYLRTTVEEELAFGLEQRGVALDEMRQRIERIAGALDLQDLLDRAPNQLSGGQTRRVALGTVLILDAPLVLLDDPFAGLDPASRQQLADVLHNLDADVVVAGHHAWLSDIDPDVNTELLGEEALLQLPEKVPSSHHGDDSYLHFPDLVGCQGAGKRRWWQFRKSQANRFEIGPVSLSIPRGGVLWLRGANGAGKS